MYQNSSEFGDKLLCKDLSGISGSRQKKVLLVNWYFLHLTLLWELGDGFKVKSSGCSSMEDGVDSQHPHDNHL